MADRKPRSLAEALKQQQELAAYIKEQKDKIPVIVGKYVVTKSNLSLLETCSDAEIKEIGRRLADMVPAIIDEMRNPKADGYAGITQAALQRNDSPAENDSYASGNDEPVSYSGRGY